MNESAGTGLSAGPCKRTGRTGAKRPCALLPICILCLCAYVFCLNGCAGGRRVTDTGMDTGIPQTAAGLPGTGSPRGSEGPFQGREDESPFPEGSGSGTGRAALSSAQQDILDRVNKERRDSGLGTVYWDCELAGMAEQRAREISGKFSHTRPDGSSWMTLLDGYNSPWTSCGENIARGQNDAEAVMDAWMFSSGHRANILKGAFTRLGVGVYKAADGRLYWVQIFAGR